MINSVFSVKDFSVEDVPVFILLGVIVGIIFVIDGWRANNTPKLSESPKIQGLLYILGGTFISAIGDLLEAQNGSSGVNSIQEYLVGCTLTIVILIAVLSILATVMAFVVMGSGTTKQGFLSRLLRSMLIAYVAFQDGFQAFIAEINKIDSEITKVTEVEKQQDVSIKFLAGYYSSVANNINNGKLNLRSFKDFVERFLRVFRDRILVNTDNYRIGIYYFHRETEQFLFYTGISPATSPHSGSYVPLQGSLFGYAVKHPHTPHLHIIDGKKEDKPFHKNYAKNWYVSAIVSTVLPSTNSRSISSDIPLLMLSIDSRIDMSKIKELAYIESMIVGLSNAFANTLLTLKISDEEFRDHLDNSQTSLHGD